MPKKYAAEEAVVSDEVSITSHSHCTACSPGKPGFKLDYNQMEVDGSLTHKFVNEAGEVLSERCSVEIGR